MIAHRRSYTPALILCLFGLAACSGSGNGAPPPTGPQACDPGTAVQDANPRPNQTGVPITLGQVIIVADGNTDTLYNNPSQWLVTLVGNAGGPLSGSPLALVPDPGGPHPFGSDFYYGSNVTTLNSGTTYTVYLGRNDGTCQAIAVGSFST